LPENIAMQGEGHSAAGCYSCRLWGPKSVHSGNGLTLLMLCHLLPMLISTTLQL